MLSTFTLLFSEALRPRPIIKEMEVEKVEKVVVVEKEVEVEEIPRSPLRAFAPSFIRTMTFKGGCTRGPVPPFDVDEESSVDNNIKPLNTLFALDSHSKAIDMNQVKMALGGNIYHGAGPALSYTKRGGHERRTYLSSDR